MAHQLGRQERRNVSSLRQSVEDGQTATEVRETLEAGRPGLLGTVKLEKPFYCVVLVVKRTLIKMRGTSELDFQAPVETDRTYTYTDEVLTWDI